MYTQYDITSPALRLTHAFSSPPPDSNDSGGNLSSYNSGHHTVVSAGGKSQLLTCSMRGQQKNMESTSIYIRDTRFESSLASFGYCEITRTTSITTHQDFTVVAEELWLH